MATTKDYRDFILEQLKLLDNITCRSMMGEYLLYYNGLLFGGIYDDRLLVKIVDSNKKYNMQESIPYESAKPMYLVDDVDNQELLLFKVLFIGIYSSFIYNLCSLVITPLGIYPYRPQSKQKTISN